MTQKRCAYFGCMHPMFEPTHGAQKYCCDECAKKGGRRAPSRIAANKKHDYSPLKTPEMVRKSNANRNKKKYSRGAKADLPPWMFS